MGYRKRITSINKKVYARELEKLIKMYEIAYGLSPDEFVRRFWGEEITFMIFRDSYDQELCTKIANIESIPSLSPECKAFQKLAIAMKWSYTYTLRFLKREIEDCMQYMTRSAESELCMDGKWRSIARKPKFVHPYSQECVE